MSISKISEIDVNNLTQIVLYVGSSKLSRVSKCFQQIVYEVLDRLYKNLNRKESSFVDDHFSVIKMQTTGLDPDFATMKEGPRKLAIQISTLEKTLLATQKAIVRHFPLLNKEDSSITHPPTSIFSLDTNNSRIISIGESKIFIAFFKAITSRVAGSKEQLEQVKKENTDSIEIASNLRKWLEDKNLSGITTLDLSSLPGIPPEITRLTGLSQMEISYAFVEACNKNDYTAIISMFEKTQFDNIWKSFFDLALVQTIKNEKPIIFDKLIHSSSFKKTTDFHIITDAITSAAKYSASYSFTVFKHSKLSEKHETPDTLGVMYCEAIRNGNFKIRTAIQNSDQFSEIPFSYLYKAMLTTIQQHDFSATVFILNHPTFIKTFQTSEFYFAKTIETLKKVAENDCRLVVSEILDVLLLQAIKGNRPSFVTTIIQFSEAHKISYLAICNALRECIDWGRDALMSILLEQCTIRNIHLDMCLFRAVKENKPSIVQVIMLSSQAYKISDEAIRKALSCCTTELKEVLSNSNRFAKFRESS